MQRFTEGHVVAHLHMTELDSVAGTRIKPNVIALESESTLHVTACHTFRIPSTTGLLEPESDSLEDIQPQISSSRLRDNARVDDKSSADEGSQPVKVRLRIAGSDDSTSSSVVDESETGSDKKHTDEKDKANGHPRLSLNSTDYLGELLLSDCCRSKRLHLWLAC